MVASMHTAIHGMSQSPPVRIVAKKCRQWLTACRKKYRLHLHGLQNARICSGFGLSMIGLMASETSRQRLYFL